LFTLWLAWHTGVWFDLRDLEGGGNLGTAFCLLGLAYSAFMKGFAALAAGTRHARLEAPLRVIAIPAALAGMYALSFRHTFLGEEPPGADWIALVPGAILFAAAALLWTPGLPRRFERADLIDTGLLLLAALSLGAGIRWFPAQVYLLANLVLLLSFLLLIARGVERRMPFSINLGIAGFLLVVITRYFEYLADRMDNAVLGFIGAGLLLLIVGLWLERRRRALLDRAKEPPR